MSSPAPSFGITDEYHAYEDIPHDDVDGTFGDMSFDPGGDNIKDDEPTAENPYEDFLSSDQPDVEPDATLLRSKPRSAKAKQYERKTKGLFAVGIKVTVQSPRTIADSAAMLLYGPNISEKVGDLAAENAMVARAVDMFTDQTENASLALMMAAFPFVLQVMRNHEREVTDSTKGVRQFKIPFIKRAISIRFRIRLPKRMRNMTQPPPQIVGRVFTNPDIVAAMRKQGINIVSE